MYLCLMKFAVIGSGNVAWHYSKMWSDAGFTLTKAYARNIEKWKICYADFPEVAFSELSEIHHDVDFVLLAVTDHQIVPVSQQLHQDAVIFHPSGATDAAAINQKIGASFGEFTLSSKDRRWITLKYHFASKEAMNTPYN